MDSSDSETRLNPSSSDPAHARGGFAPGFAFTERYRIVSLLGRGAMGEVYRAEDVRLEQPIALKFLPDAMTHDAEARERLFAEARNARSVAHPNVCRVYDVGEFEGRVFLTMEYVDGEDLASLLRRIGRLPGPKALEIARQLCAGLYAAHERGILHRDLKPSNVMIDGRGAARITDFGLAVNTERAAPADLAGTMPYMAPERFRGAPATVQSDLYALGLILYETFTGQRAFSAPTATLEEWRSVHDSSAPARPVTLANDIDAATERAILRCLEKDPARRPASALRVAAALPGGDPLAAALAAGETPSPALVAASGADGALSRRAAWVSLLACLLSLSAAAGVWQWRVLANMVGTRSSPEVLQDKAREVLSLGGWLVPGDAAWWFADDVAQREYLAHSGPDDHRYRSAARAAPTPLRFQYRSSQRHLQPENVAGVVTAEDPPLWFGGDALVQLDSSGRLMDLRVMFGERDTTDVGVQGAEPDWNALLAMAGLDRTGLTSDQPRWVPRVATDIRRAWIATIGGAPVRFEAAAYHGRLVFARLSGPWNSPDADADPHRDDGVSPVRGVATAVLAVFWILTLVAVALLARRNLRLGRGDRRGAIRVSVFALIVGMAASVVGRHWAFDATRIWTVISTHQGRVLFSVTLVWLSYLGLEPFVRRTSPHWLIAWTRLLEGRWRDPLVGQALLAGVVFGTLTPVIAALPDVAAALLGLDGAQPYFQPASLAPPPAYLSAVLWALLNGVTNTLAFVGFIVAARFVLRNDRVVMIAVASVATLASVSDARPFALDVVQAAIIGIGSVWFIRRFGVLALTVGLALNWIVRLTPWTLELSAWFAWRPVLTILLGLSVAIWGFLNVLGRQSAFPEAGLDS